MRKIFFNITIYEGSLFLEVSFSPEKIESGFGAFLKHFTIWMLRFLFVNLSMNI